MSSTGSGTRCISDGLCLMRVVLNGGPRLVVVMALLLLLCTRVQNSVHSYNCSCVHKSYEHNVSTNEANAENKPVKHCCLPCSLSVFLLQHLTHLPSIPNSSITLAQSVRHPSMDAMVCVDASRWALVGWELATSDRDLPVMLRSWPESWSLYFSLR